MRFADRPRPTQQRLAGAEPVEEGLSRFWQVSTAFNGSQHAHSRLPAARFIGKRANATSNGNALAAHARIQHARTQIEIPRPRRKGARLLSPPPKSESQNKNPVSFARNLRLGIPSTSCTWRKTTILALKRGDLPEKLRTYDLESSAIAIFLQNHAKSCCGSGTEH